MVSRARKAAQASYQRTERKNFVFNGDMAVAQRGSSISIGAGAYLYGACDRWMGWSGSAVAFDMKTSTGVVPDGFRNSLHLDITTADASLAAGDAMYIHQKFEGMDLQILDKGDSAAKAVTVSFWVRSPKTGVHIVELYDTDNSRHCSQSYTISSADTWEYHSVTFPGDTTGALDNDTVASFYINFWLQAGSTYSGGGSLGTTWNTTANTRVVGQVNVGDDAANNFYITGVQMELGNTATDFQRESYQANLERCLRYYFANYGTNYGQVYSTTQSFTNIDIQVAFRAVPTFDSYSAIRTTTGLAYYPSKDHAQVIQTATNGYISNVRLNAEI